MPNFVINFITEYNSQSMVGDLKQSIIEKYTKICTQRTVLGVQ